MLVARNYLTDQVSLSAGFPVLRAERILFGSSLAAAQSRAIDTQTGTLATHNRFWLANLSLGWFPDVGVAVALQYQHYRQQGEANDLAPVPTFSRNVVQLTLSGMFPPQEVPPVPAGPPMRVDGGDRTPMGQGSVSSHPRGGR